MPEQLRRFRETAPGIGFDLFHGPAHELTDRVGRGQSDIAITSPRPKGQGFGWHRLYVERLCLAVPRGHRMATRTRVRIAVVPVQSDGGEAKTVHIALSNAGTKREVGLVLGSCSVVVPGSGSLRALP